VGRLSNMDGLYDHCTLVFALHLVKLTHSTWYLCFSCFFICFFSFSLYHCRELKTTINCLIVSWRDWDGSWSAMKRTSTARSSLHHACSGAASRVVPEVSDILPHGPELDSDAGTLFSDESTTCDIDDILGDTEHQPTSSRYRPQNSK